MYIYLLWQSCLSLIIINIINDIKLFISEGLSSSCNHTRNTKNFVIYFFFLGRIYIYKGSSV